MAALSTTLQPIIDSINKNYNARVLRNNFADGYSQRVPDGLNTIDREITVSFIGTAAEVKVYSDALEACKGATTFQWTPPGETGSLNWTSDDWSVVLLSNSLYKITIKMKREFDN
jgi:phage-related protein